MTETEILALRAVLENAERRRAGTAALYAHEHEFHQQPQGISVLIPVHNGAAELPGLLHSLTNQSLNRRQFEAIFCLNDCQDQSRILIETVCAGTDLSFRVIETDQPGISRARNQALAQARFRYATFVDHDDFLSRGYLETLVALSDYRSVVVTNIMRVEAGRLEPDYAQQVIGEGFAISPVHGPADIDLCFRAYTLNAIKAAPTYMLNRVRYDENLGHCEDVNYWREVFHAFTPITVKAPGWRAIYYRGIRPASASRGHRTVADWATPRQEILRRIAADAQSWAPLSPQHRFDQALAQLLLSDLKERGVAVTMPPWGEGLAGQKKCGS